MQDLFFDHAFWIALIQIVGIDIVLSGDNAVVIALAARGLDPEQRKKAVMWGSSAAVAMRVTLTVLAAELLQLPLLKAGGALLLLWIAIQLLVPEDEGEGDGVTVAKGSMIAAIKTIMLADLVMSMDNVVAIAGASKGSVLLLVIGLGLSIPLVIFSSTFLMKVMERFPVVVTAGAALLGFVAGEMAVSDLFVGPWVDAHAHWLHQALPPAGAVLVVLAGKLLAARVQAREAHRQSLELDLGEAARPGSGEAR